MLTNALSFERVASPSTSSVGNRSALVMRSPARASATRRRGDRDIRIVRERLVDQPVERRVAEDRPPRIRQLRRSVALLPAAPPAAAAPASPDRRATRCNRPGSTRTSNASEQNRQPTYALASPHFSPAAAFAAFLRRQPAIQRKNSGTKNVAMNVAASMPPITLVPSE